MKKNPKLVKNMKHVKFDQIPPLSGPDPRGLINQTKQDKPNQLDKINGRHRQSIHHHQMYSNAPQLYYLPGVVF